MADATPERWLPVVGYEGIYEVSDHGRVRRVAPRRGGRAREFLPGRTTEKGYQRVGLRRAGKTRRHTIHSLVLEAFVGLRPAGHVCNHKDGDKQNNRIANLEWVTPSENGRHAYRIGLKVAWPMPGERNGSAKLVSEQVAEIRHLGGMIPQQEIAAMYGVSRSTVRDILLGATWRPTTSPASSGDGKAGRGRKGGRVAGSDTTDAPPAAPAQTALDGPEPPGWEQ